jgi:hypothetical protein
MDIEEIYGNLCYHDLRNINNYYSDGDDDPEDTGPLRQDECYCYNCFYGRDKLAMEIIRLREIIENN